MSFTYDSTTSRGRVRLIIADTNSASYVFEDAEIDAFLTLQSDDVQLAAVQALRSIVASRAKLSIYYSVNGFTMDRRDVAKTLLALADKIEESASSAPFEFESVLEYLVDRVGQDRSNYVDSEP